LEIKDRSDNLNLAIKLLLWKHTPLTALVCKLPILSVHAFHVVSE
jgi:hypothetical protein